ncbi:hypothetical protein PSCICL_44090 [Pseudomonas cichorii]|nr:hypothetical protein PSCICL_44090 [Pseudomonas cichorii]
MYAVLRNPCAAGQWLVQPAGTLFVDFDPVTAQWTLGAMLEGAANTALVHKGVVAQWATQIEQGLEKTHDLSPVELMGAILPLRRYTPITFLWLNHCDCSAVPFFAGIAILRHI